MLTIFKVAAGVLIAMLIFQMLTFQRIDDMYEEQTNQMMVTQDLKNRYIILTNSIHSYYRKNKALPKFISDLECVDVFNTLQKIDCANIHANGIFYVKHNNDWAAAEPYIYDGRLYNKCASTISLGQVDPEYRGCATLDISSIPTPQYPSFDCPNAASEAEKLICASDKLTANDNKLLSIYDQLQEQSASTDKQEVIEDKNNFYDKLRTDCKTTSCIEEMTNRKISRLELLGIWKPK